MKSFLRIKPGIRAEENNRIFRVEKIKIHIEPNWIVFNDPPNISLFCNDRKSQGL